MAFDKILKITAVFFLVAAVGLYLATRVFSILFFGLLVAGMACGRYSNRLSRLNILRGSGNGQAVRVDVAQKWLKGTESKSDRFATNYVTPAIIFIGLIIALMKRSMGIFLFILLLIVIDAIDRVIIHRMDKHSNRVIDEYHALKSVDQEGKRGE